LFTELTSTKTQLSELEVALSKVKLADRLGCTVNELKTHTIKCPAEKLGHLIGKGGVNIKKLEARTGCLITLDKSTNLINLQGNEESVNTATQEIENITCSIEAEINLSKPICLFLRKKVCFLALGFSCIYIYI
jgi:polyribonucleotide nucleotidyltransferase